MVDVETARNRSIAKGWMPAVIAYLVLLVIFPVPMITVGMLVATFMMLMSIYVLWTQTHDLDAGRRARYDHRVPRVLLGGLLFGFVAAFVWPATTAIIAFSASVLACGVWFVLERTVQDRSHT